MKITADTARGCKKVDDFDDDVEITDQDTFYAMLSSLEDGAIIGADIDEAMAEKIEAEYGIR